MPDSAPLFIIGAGGHAKVVAHAALEAGLNLVGFLSDLAADEGREIFGLPVWSRQTKMSEPARFHIAIGANAVRAKLVDEMVNSGWTPVTIAHPSAVIAQGASIGAGTFIGPQAVIHPDAGIGRGTIVNTAAIVEHDCRIGDYGHLSPRCVLGGHVDIGERSWIGMGATLRDRVTIGADVMIGAGSVVVSDIEGPGTAYGVPAKLRPSD